MVENSITWKNVISGSRRGDQTRERRADERRKRRRDETGKAEEAEEASRAKRSKHNKKEDSVELKSKMKNIFELRQSLEREDFDRFVAEIRNSFPGWKWKDGSFAVPDEEPLEVENKHEKFEKKTLRGIEFMEVGPNRLVYDGRADVSDILEKIGKKGQLYVMDVGKKELYVYHYRKEGTILCRINFTWSTWSSFVVWSQKHDEILYSSFARAP